MIWLTILTMTLIIFASRYLFLDPRLPIKLNYQTQRFLSYSSPAVLTAIWAPIVFLPDNKTIDLTYTNPYLIGAVVAALIAWKTKNVLLTAVISMTVFFIVSL
ncbi:AzlD domain-containing protein [Photobacterium halotolerans]|uniref:AzlD domain-containing protein n=1 Tax=Photobacterium halotolerans TaxID=265726 RepID=A0A7X4WAK0_9GAMM|nr:AzlD domain-containing protein [Photobacterium halotolerans]NAW64290.1 AzlD domain-containing protein [Photobacterium halotolerans]